MVEQPVVVTGARGMLGSELVRVTPIAAVRGVDIDDGDLAEPGVGQRLFEGAGGVIHCAGYTDVDGAEADPEQAERDNATATLRVAEACSALNIRCVVLGSDYVFDGESERPYREDDTPNPLGVYGHTKLEAERAALEHGAVVVRTQWLYGPNGSHFPKTVLGLKGRISVVDDQRGSPTSTLQLAPALWDVLRSEAAGVFHAACEGSCSWYQFAAFIRGPETVTPCKTDQFPRPARRPKNSVLDCSRLTSLRGRPLAHWQAAWKEYVEL